MIAIGSLESLPSSVPVRFDEISRIHWVIRWYRVSVSPEKELFMRRWI